MKRRRFLSLCAAAAATPLHAAAPLRWQGHAMGAAVSLDLWGPEAVVQPALEAALAAVAAVERTFSLYDPTSVVSQLNQKGVFLTPPALMQTLCARCTEIHAATEGLFDPTVQSVWAAARIGGDVSAARKKIGWDSVVCRAEAATLAPGQAVTFNGIAQGFATDCVSAVLRRHGLENIHVNMGEHAVSGPSRRLGLVDPVHAYLGSVTVRDAAVATSSMFADQIGGVPHILAPDDRSAQWDSVCVIAQSAAVADGLSTGLCFADLALVRKAKRVAGVQRIVLVDVQGDVISL